MRHLKSYLLAMIALALAMTGPSAAQEDGWIKLFNGKNLSGWKRFGAAEPADAPLKQIWSVKDGVITCEGSVNGYLITEKEYADYILKVDWRWGNRLPKKGNANSGVFVHVTGPDKIWPKAIEAQLMANNAGDFWLVDNFKLKVDPSRQDPKTPRHYYRMIKDGVENPMGEWNQYEITCRGDTIKLVINGKHVNEGTDAELTKGKILLQSEGAEIHFRNVMLKHVK